MYRKHLQNLRVFLSEMDKENADGHSPHGVLEDYLRSLESDTVSSTESTSDAEDQKDLKPTSRWIELVQLVKTKSKRHLATFQPLNGLRLYRRFSGSLREEIAMATVTIEDASFACFKPRWKNFTLSQLQSATRNFSHENLLGTGGYAEVFKGSLRDGKLVAVKRLTRGPLEERIGNFLSELGIMAHVNHPNATKLIGYGVEGGMHFVLELSPRGSLASWLHVSKVKLKWSMRYKIALGTAEGLSYLHEGCRRRIIHRDIKAANILLTEDFEPQICDFGLAKWLPDQWTHHTVSNFEGTFGYLAPEYLMHGIIDEKTDTFAFGVLLLELISGRRALDYSRQSLIFWARPLLRKNDIRELLDPCLADEYNVQQMNLVVLAAALCVQQSSLRRPQMSHVLQLLKGNNGCLELLMKNCRKTPSWKKYYEEIFSAESSSLVASTDSLCP